MVALLQAAPLVPPSVVTPFEPKLLLMQAIPFDAILRAMPRYGFRVARSVQIDRIALTFMLPVSTTFSMGLSANYMIADAGHGPGVQLGLGASWTSRTATPANGFTCIPLTEDPERILDALRAFFSTTPLAGHCPLFELPAITIRNVFREGEDGSDAPCAVWAESRHGEALGYAHWWADRSYLNICVRTSNGDALMVRPTVFG